MSWLSQLLKGAKLLQVIIKVKEEAPHAVPLLEALEANDYNAAASVVLAFGEVHEVQDLLAAQVTGLVETIVAATPVESQETVRALLAANLSSDVQEKLLQVILSAGLRKVDDIIPEEAILDALKVVGLH